MTDPMRSAHLHRFHSSLLPRACRGFTLLELLVVMVIIGLLAGFVAPKLFAQIGKSEVKVARAQIESLGKALDQYRIDTGRYPSSAQGLAALVARPGDEARWAGPYLAKAVPADPWGRPYQYRSPGEHGDYDLWSGGKDGAQAAASAEPELRSW
jgi:general secretion pathway protein G